MINPEDDKVTLAMSYGSLVLVLREMLADGRVRSLSFYPDGRVHEVLIDLPQDQIDAEWEQFRMRHIVPSRLCRLAFGMIEETDADREHLVQCDLCRRVYDGYRAEEPAT